MARATETGRSWLALYQNFWDNFVDSSINFPVSKQCLLALGAIALFFTLSLPAEAAFCRTEGGKSICILQIKRSAKNYWQYRASVRVNGTVTPIEVYDCRRRVKTPKNGQPIPFESRGAGELICRFANHSSG